MSIQEKISIPKAQKKAHTLSMHGHDRVDPYFWMKEREDPELLAHLHTENAYTKAQLLHTEDFQEQIYEEIVGRIKKKDVSAPYFRRGYYYYTRYEDQKEYPIYCRKKDNLEASEEILIDVNQVAKGHSFCNVTEPAISMDNQLMIYGVDFVSRRQYTLHIQNIATGEVYAESIPNTSGRGMWANDNQTFYYTQKNKETLRAEKIFRHTLGDDIANDEEIYHETDETYIVYAGKSKSDQYIVLCSYSTLATEFRVIDANDPKAKWQVITERKRNHEYFAYHYEDYFYIRTNHEAKNFRLMRTPVGQTGMEHWEEVIPHRADVLLEYVEIFKEFLVVGERSEGLPHLRIINWQNKEEHYIHFDEPAYNAYSGINLDFNTNLLRYSYTSMTTPPSVVNYNMHTREKTLLKQQEVIGDFKVENYQTERLWIPARDGQKVPFSLVYKKGTAKDGTAPLLMVGYGSYGFSYEVYFSAPGLSLLDRGFIFGIAHIRGGEDLGRAWYEDGKLLKKKNTFNDFVDCAQYLVDHEYTSPDRLFARGGSAGGLLVGAVANMRPDLFKGIIADVPFVDVVTTMLDDSIPLTTGEYDEWGNPNEQAYYEYMLSYSPYDNVKKQKYPHMLVTTGFHDSQVQYWEPAKWVAKLRDCNLGDTNILFDVDMDAGHGGASGRFSRHKLTAKQYTFMLDLVGRMD